MLKVGDIVQLKSGGPSMTIRSIGDDRGNDRVHCIWFSEGQLAGSVFIQSTLKKIEK